MTTARADFSERCVCGRVGNTYALLLCVVDAPIPYVLTPRGLRDAKKMRQWDVLFGPLEERRARDSSSRKEALAEGRKIAARVRREARSGRARVVPTPPAPGSAAAAGVES